jgi:D-amino peptidase
MFDTLKFEKSDDHTLLLTRRFDAPRELVFAAYTTPALMRRWLIGPPGWTIQVCEFKPVAGFRYRLEWRNDADSSQQFGLGGTVLEIDPPHRMVTTELFDGQGPEAESVQTIELTETDGITTLRQTFRGTDDYAWGRQLMTEETNAGIAGAFDAGADTVVVTDSDGEMGNLRPHGLDPRAELVQGTPKVPFSMMTGIVEGFSLAAFIGYHAGAGTPNAILDHTYTGFITDVRVNGETWNETHLNAALAGTFGVPVGFVAGDRACCTQAEEKLPWIRTVAVKDGFGNRVGRSRSPETAREAICAVLGEVVRHPERLELFVPSGPFTLEVDVINTAVADMCALSPGTERSAPRGVRFETPDVRELYRCLLTWMNLGQRVAPSYTIE